MVVPGPTSGIDPSTTEFGPARRPIADRFAAFCAAVAGVPDSFDDQDRGGRDRWFAPQHGRRAWLDITVPGTWDLQIAAGFDRRTIGWHACEFVAPGASTAGFPTGVSRGLSRQGGRYRETSCSSPAARWTNWAPRPATATFHNPGTRLRGPKRPSASVSAFRRLSLRNRLRTDATRP